MSGLIATAGNKAEMPISFPLDTPENAGNMVHARAPHRMFRKTGTVDYFADKWSLVGEKSFADFVNNHCSHIIFTLANSIKLDSKNPKPYVRLKAMLELYDIPITIFGLGTRSHTDVVDDVSLLPEAVELLQYLDRRCAPVGVRGEFTKKVFEQHAGMQNVVVTGCPSFFSEPNAFTRLSSQLEKPKPGRFLYSGTKFNRAEERRTLLTTIKSDGFYLEPTSAENHRAHLQALKGTQVNLPEYLVENNLVAESGAKPTSDQVSYEQVVSFFENRYRLFHHVDEWMDFNRRVVSYSFGTRFHVNMATLLSGKPATWVEHDTRTSELTNFLHLPSVSLKESASMEPSDFRRAAKFDSMFANIEHLFDNWAAYMAAHNLPYERPVLRY